MASGWSSESQDDDEDEDKDDDEEAAAAALAVATAELETEFDVMFKNYRNQSLPSTGMASTPASASDSLCQPTVRLPPSTCGAQIWGRS